MPVFYTPIRPEQVEDAKRRGLCIIEYRERGSRTFPLLLFELAKKHPSLHTGIKYFKVYYERSQEDPAIPINDILSFRAYYDGNLLPLGPRAITLIKPGNRRPLATVSALVSQLMRHKKEIERKQKEVEGKQNKKKENQCIIL